MPIEISRSKKLFLSSVMGIFIIILAFLLFYDLPEDSHTSANSMLRVHTEGDGWEKSNGYFSVVLNVEKSNANDFKLLAKIKPLQSFDNVRLNWNLPEFVELIEGESIQELGSLDHNREYEYEILVRITSDTPVNIIVECSALQDGIKLGGYDIIEINPLEEQGQGPMTKVQKSMRMESSKEDIILQ